jgi:hypothetical protein
MFHPVDHPMKRGWVGRIDGEHVIQLAAQTLQAFFTGGGSAREHAVYPLDGVRLLASVLHPPSVRVFDDQRSFAFGNSAAIVGPDAGIPGGAMLRLLPRIAGVVGADDALAGFSAVADWRRPELAPPKDRDFALALGPIVVTRDELDPDGLEAVVRVDAEERLRGRLAGFDWEAARAHAVDGTMLRPGDLLVGPPLDPVDELAAGSVVELEVSGIGSLSHSLTA